MQSKFPYCYFICCVFWWQTILETEKSELVLHLTGTHPDGQPLNVMFPFAVPTDLRSSSLLLVCWCVLLSGFIMSWFEYYIIKYCFPPSNYPDSSPSDMDHASDRHAEAVNPLGRWATWGVMVVLPSQAQVPGPQDPILHFLLPDLINKGINMSQKGFTPCYSLGSFT